MTDDTTADPPGPQRITRTLVAALRAMRDAAGEITVTQVAAATGISPNTTLALMRRMEGWGTITGRWSEPAGRRPVRLYELTPAGAQLAAHLDDRPAREAAPC